VQQIVEAHLARNAEQLREVVPGRVFRVRADVQAANTPFHLASLATIFVGDHRHLTILNPVPLTPSVRDQVRELHATWFAVDARQRRPRPGLRPLTGVGRRRTSGKTAVRR
jgi:hypothetical protein